MRRPPNPEKLHFVHQHTLIRIGAAQAINAIGYTYNYSVFNFFIHKPLDDLAQIIVRLGLKYFNFNHDLLV